MNSTSKFVDATELSGTHKEGFDPPFLKRLGQTFALGLARTRIPEDGPVIVTSDGMVPEILLRNLVDGLLVAGCPVLEFGALEGDQLELVQIATTARGAVRVRRALAAPEVTGGTFLDATQEESMPEPDGDQADVVFAAELFVGRVPQLAERLHDLMELMSSNASVSGAATYAQATYEQYVPDANRAEQLREHARTQTLVEPVAS